jgi:hypothetical protein
MAAVVALGVGLVEVVVAEDAVEETAEELICAVALEHIFVGSEDVVLVDEVQDAAVDAAVDVVVDAVVDVADQVGAQIVVETEEASVDLGEVDPAFLQLLVGCILAGSAYMHNWAEVVEEVAIPAYVPGAEEASSVACLAGECVPAIQDAKYCVEAVEMGRAAGRLHSALEVRQIPYG